MNTCGACTHHRLIGPLATHGYGHCQARPAALREAIATSDQATCRIGLFDAKKQDLAATPSTSGLRGPERGAGAPEGL